MNKMEIVESPTQLAVSQGVDDFVKCNWGEQASAEERVQGIYNSPGGPLIGWLFDEARRRRHNFKILSKSLGVTYGYINQLRTGLRNPAQISQGMCEACARYLGVAPIVVKLISGGLSMSDFVVAQESEENLVNRACRQIQDDPAMRKILPGNIDDLPYQAKKSLALMYGEMTGKDVFRLNELPNVIHWLQRSAVIHDENEFLAARGH